MGGQKYYRMLTSDKFRMMLEHPLLIFGVLCIIFSLLIVPQVARSTYTLFDPFREDRLVIQEMEEESDIERHLIEGEQKELKDTVRKQEGEIGVLRAELA